eukprot:2752472-Pyramimonas_sp.AAC.1
MCTNVVTQIKSANYSDSDGIILTHPQRLGSSPARRYRCTAFRSPRSAASHKRAPLIPYGLSFQGAPYTFL